MIKVIADNITSPLGMTSSENYQKVKDGESCLHRYEGVMDIPTPFTASLFTEEQWDTLMQYGDYTRFESSLIHSIREALNGSDVDATSPRVIFIISTTKGNVELLDHRSHRLKNRITDEAVRLGNAALMIARYFGNPNTPVTVSNACISGLAAQLTAKRMLESGRYDYAIVAGADIQSRFIISGFQSFKALSPKVCRPFDIDRCGLNLGEAAACMIFGRMTAQDTDGWVAVRGAVRNDAHHISSPSRTAEGAYRAIAYAMADADTDQLAVVNAHGTSTLYNDEMESVAIARSGLEHTPVNSLKGYYGHTMGAAGLLETILTMKAIDDHIILGTRGFQELGVSRHIRVIGEHIPTDKRSFLKLLSGFGGSNAAMLYQKGGRR